MTKLTQFVAIASLAIGLAACGTEETDTPGPATMEQPEVTEQAPGMARMEGDEQVVEIDVLDTGYEPASIQLQAGVPARLVFTRHSETTCAEQVQAPDFDVEPVELPLHESVDITFTPDEGGEYSFVCGMNMLRGTIVVQS